MDPDRLSALQIDALREVGSIGAGHAATALSQLVGTRVAIEVPVVRFLPIAEVPAVLGGPETLVGAGLSRLRGDLEGALLFVADETGVLVLCDLLRSRPPGSTVSVGADEEALFTRAASALETAYVSAVARLTGLAVVPSETVSAFDMVGAILEVVASEVDMTAETAVLVTTRFSTAEAEVDASLFYLPAPQSLDVLLGRLGVT